MLLIMVCAKSYLDLKTLFQVTQSPLIKIFRDRDRLTAKKGSN